MADISASGEWLDGVICEKPAKTVTYNCRASVASPSACGDSALSLVYVSAGAFSSSTFVSGFHSSNILNNGPWQPDSSDSDPWVQVDFGSNPMYIRAITTLGSPSNDGMVTGYRVHYYRNGEWIPVMPHRSYAEPEKFTAMGFAGNGQASTKNAQEVCPRKLTYKVKVQPTAFVGLPIMRLEMKGCSAQVEFSPFCECRLQSFDRHDGSGYRTDFPYWLNSANYDSKWQNSGEGSMWSSIGGLSNGIPDAWIPHVADSNNWFQVNFKILKVVTGIIMMGNPKNNERILSYNLKWSHTGHNYTFNYYLAMDGFPKVFAGPALSGLPTQQTFCPPVKAKAIRIIPLTFDTKPSMMLDVYACPSTHHRCFDCCDEISLCTCACPVGWSGPTCSTVAIDRNYYIDAPAPTCESEDLVQDVDNFGGSIVATSGDDPYRGDGVTRTEWNIEWKPSNNDPLPYWQVNFGRVLSIGMVSVAGSNDGRTSFYSLWFKVEDSANLFYPVLTNQLDSTSAIRRFIGGRDFTGKTYTDSRLCPNIRSQSLRLIPLEFEDRVTFKVKVKGCPAHAPCSTCCTYENGCQCKCPLGYVSTFQAASQLNPWPRCDMWNAQPIDCEDLALKQPTLPSGIYTIYPPGQNPFQVYCEMKLLGGGWTVIQMRTNTDVDFFTNWDDYKNGFGIKDTNFWLGNDYIHQFTTTGNRYNLLVKLTTSDGEYGIGYYDGFHISDESDKYRLHIGSYECGNIGDSLAYHDGETFKTKDSADNTCAQLYMGAWWYRDCLKSNLNGIFGSNEYGKGMVWDSFRGISTSMASSALMLRRSPLKYVLPRNFSKSIVVGSLTFLFYRFGTFVPLSIGL